MNHNSRWKFPLFMPNRIETEEPPWSPLIKTNKQVTIWPEQGFGDLILYSRFFNDLPQI